MTLGIITGIYFSEGLCSSHCLLDSAVNTIPKIEERLADRIRERSHAIIDKGYFPDTPALRCLFSPSSYLIIIIIGFFGLTMRFRDT